MGSKPKDLEWKKLQGYSGNSSFYETHDTFITPSTPFLKNATQSNTKPEPEETASNIEETVTPKSSSNKKEAEEEHQKVLSNIKQDDEVTSTLKRRNSKKSSADKPKQTDVRKKIVKSKVIEEK